MVMVEESGLMKSVNSDPSTVRQIKNETMKTVTSMTTLP
jgi:hypothetical protein